jgi:hypothetical protein
LNINQNQTSEEISKFLNTKFNLKLDELDIIMLSKYVTKKINKIIKKCTISYDKNKNSFNMQVFNDIIIDLNKICSNKKIKIIVTVNRQKLIFYLDKKFYLQNEDNKLIYDDIIEETLKYLDNNNEYDLQGLKLSLKGVISSSINNTLKENKNERI